MRRTLTALILIIGTFLTLYSIAGAQLVAGWSLSCKIDKMDDSRFCSMMLPGGKGNLVVALYDEREPPVITVGHTHMPGSKIAIRIDKNEQITASAKTGFSKDQIQIILEQLRHGKTVATRYQKWPNRKSIDSSIELKGFSEAWGALQEQFKTLGKRE